MDACIICKENTSRIHSLCLEREGFAVLLFTIKPDDKVNYDSNIESLKKIGFKEAWICCKCAEGLYH